MKSVNVQRGFSFCGGWNFSKLVNVGSTFIREMRVAKIPNQINALYMQKAMGNFKPNQVKPPFLLCLVRNCTIYTDKP